MSAWVFFYVNNKDGGGPFAFHWYIRKKPTLWAGLFTISMHSFCAVTGAQRILYSRFSAGGLMQLGQVPDRATGLSTRVFLLSLLPFGHR